MKILFFTIILFTNMVFLKVEAETKNLEAPTNDTNNVKKYTQDEFDQELKEKLSKELEKNLKRFGQGNIVDFSNELLKKENELKARELQMAKDSEQLELIKADFEKKIKKFQENQNNVIGCIDFNDKEKAKRVSHMVEIVSGMKPQVAAEVLSVQEADLSVRILGLLEPTKVSKIFNLMNKEISARLQKQYLDMKR